MNANSLAQYHWGKPNSLQLNPAKTQVWFLTQIKIWQIKMTSNFNWDPQINSVISETNKTSYFLKKKCSQLPISICKQAPSRLVFPHLDYASVLLTNLTKKQESKIDQHLNRSVRFGYTLNHQSGTSTLLQKTMLAHNFI